MDFFEYWESGIRMLSNEMTEVLDRNITEQEVFAAIYKLYCNEQKIEWPGDVYDLEVSFSEFSEQLKRNLWLFEMQEVRLPEDLFPGLAFSKKKQWIRVDGVKWVYHPNDPDPFPSTPHLHCSDENLKLNPFTGEIYRNKKVISRVTRKTLELIREKMKFNFNTEV